MDQLNFLPKEPHCCLIVGQTGCGKTVFTLDLLETVYYNFFEHIVIFCTTLKYNKSYRNRNFIWKDSEVYLVDPSDKLDQCLEHFYKLFEGTQTLFILDDVAAESEMCRKRKMLSKLAFSGRHANVSVFLLTQKYNSVLKDFREQAKVVVLFHCKDRKSFDECLIENDVIEDKGERKKIKTQLREKKHNKLVLKTFIPSKYVCL